MKSRVIVGDTIVLDEWENKRNVISYQIDEEIDEAIPKARIVIRKDRITEDKLKPSTVVEIFEGETEPIRIFYGFITHTQEKDLGFEITAYAETVKLLRERINKIYLESSDLEGKNHLIVGNLIELSGLTPKLKETDESYVLEEFRCINAVPLERIIALQKGANFQIRYSPSERVVVYEPRGFRNINKILATKNNIAGIPEWQETDEGMINYLKIIGATVNTIQKEEGAIGDTGFDVDRIVLNRIPNSVELTLNGDIKTGGSKDSPDVDYYVVPSERKIIPTTNFQVGDNVYVKYSWLAPTPVMFKNQNSIDEYGLFREEVVLSDITSVSDAESRASEIVNNRSKPFITGKIKVLKKEDVRVGDLVTINDEINRKKTKGEFIVRKIVRNYPSFYNDVEVGDKELRLEHDFIELEERVKRLEEQLVISDETLIDYIDLNDFGFATAEFVSRYFAIEQEETSSLLQGLQFYYKLDEKIGTSVTDQKGKYNGITNGIWTSGFINNGLKLINNNMKIDTYYQIPEPNSNDKFTLAGWTYFDEEQGKAYFGGSGISSEGKFDLMVILESNTLSLDFGGSTSTSATPNIGWNHIAITKEGVNEYDVYLNGERKLNSISLDGTMKKANLMIGVYKTKGPYVIPPRIAIIDEIGLWDKALSYYEINQIYNGGKGLDYPFEE